MLQKSEKNSSKQKSSVIHFMNAIHHFCRGMMVKGKDENEKIKQTVEVLQLPKDWGILP